MSTGSLKVTILGCGSSTGVPRIGNDWGACDPNEPRNRRRRCSVLVEKGQGDQQTSVLVDTSPDLREQLLSANVGRLDGVLYTHDHADQTHGIDDLRTIALRMQKRVDVHFDQATADTLTKRFGYCFKAIAEKAYPPILNGHLIPEPFAPLTITGPGGVLTALPFEQDHGIARSLGFRFGPVAYSADVVNLPEESFVVLEGIECWIVDALRYAPHPTHAHVGRALDWIARVRPKRAVLTNLHVDLDYATLKRELPAGVEPAYDGMTIEV